MKPFLQYHPERKLLVGVLSHPFCNPAVSGCGFCTFPHQLFNRRKAEAVVNRVVREIGRRVRTTPGLRDRRVEALYIGGGTANLTPPDSFRELCRGLSRASSLFATLTKSE